MGTTSLQNAHRDPKLIYKNVIYLEGSALFPTTPCAWATSNLNHKTLMKKHVGTPTRENFHSSAGCDLGGCKCESHHLSAWFPAIPCAQATYRIWSIILIKEHVGAPIWEGLNSTRVGCDLGGSKCESLHLSAWFCMVLHGSLPSGNIPNLTYKTRIKEHVGTQIWENLNSTKSRLWFRSF